MFRKERNLNFMPDISQEGFFVDCMPPVPDPVTPGKQWYDTMNACQRLHYHQTLNSARRFARFQPYDNGVPNDALDIKLRATYNHSGELFSDREDVVVQVETIGYNTFRRLRNTKDVFVPAKIPLGHPLQIGGVTEKKSPHSVKLINVGQHLPLTNPGYSRQKGDGNIFNY